MKKWLFLVLSVLGMQACQPSASTETNTQAPAEVSTLHQSDLAMATTHKFVHVVNFNLKKGLTEAEIAQFEEGAKSLSKIKTVQVFNLGKPASTDREIIDRSYDYCLLVVFKDKADHDYYQIDPIHDVFRETCSKFFDKVVIFDSETI